MPRSGTSLIEQILSAHPDIHAGGELAILEPLFNKYFGPDTFNSKISMASTETFHAIGQEYIDNLRKLNSTARFITDKMPHNFHYVGLIALTMPNAKIIHCQRNPVDTCLSCFQKLFGTGHNYSYNLQELGKHYLYYQELMAYWHKLLPRKILDVQYENVVNDLESQVKRLTDYCGLPWKESCLEFHRSNRPVITASRDQANRPIYKDSMQRWKHYERHLQPLLDIINKQPQS